MNGHVPVCVTHPAHDTNALRLEGVAMIKIATAEGIVTAMITGETTTDVKGTIIHAVTGTLIRMRQKTRDDGKTMASEMNELRQGENESIANNATAIGHPARMPGTVVIAKVADGEILEMLPR